MYSEDSIQARLGGNSLPTCIKQTQPSVTNLGNIVAVKEHKGHAISGGNVSVIQSEILLAGDSSVHQAFNLSHGSFAVDLLSMDQVGGNCKPPVPVFKVSHVVADVTFLHASPPGSVRFIAKQFSNILTEIIAFCHAIVEIHQVVVVANDIGVEVIFQVNSSATNVVWIGIRQKSTPLTITKTYGSD